MHLRSLTSGFHARLLFLVTNAVLQSGHPTYGFVGHVHIFLWAVSWKPYDRDFMPARETCPTSKLHGNLYLETCLLLNKATPKVMLASTYIKVTRGINADMHGSIQLEANRKRKNLKSSKISFFLLGTLEPADETVVNKIQYSSVIVHPSSHDIFLYLFFQFHTFTTAGHL